MVRLGMLTVSCFLGIIAPLLAQSSQRVEFNRDIRPLLSDACFACHGPDKARRKADLRLDTEAGAFADLGDRRVLVPGKPDQSELFRRITAQDEAERMPPKKHGVRLTTAQVVLIRRWIEQGAKWQPHWAFIPPKRPELPKVKNQGRVRNPIDAHVLARLEQEGLSPSPEADRAVLLRRVTLDLTGLPPTPAETDAFLADTSPNAYEKVVDRLLASPRYAERMAVRWLNAARYADSNGYQSDGERIMWRWRDWVIEAFNCNMPFDQFTIEQLAGDLLPNPTLDQKIATGFNRNHRGNAEGGIIPEEYAVEYVADRVETTATVWLGLTLGCSRCHDHKFDPVKQKEYYQLFAYFNNLPEQGRAIKYGNSPPVIKSPTVQQQKQLAQLKQRLGKAHRKLDALAGEIDRAQQAWEKELLHSSPLQWFPGDHLQAALASDGQSLDLDGSRPVEMEPTIGDFGFYDRFSLSVRFQSRQHQGTILSRMVDEDRAEGYALQLVDGKLQLNLVKRFLDDALRVETERQFEPGQWHHVLVTYDGSRVASGVHIYVDGRPEKLKVLLDELNQSFRTKEPIRIGAGGGPEKRFHGQIAQVRIYNDCLGEEEARILSVAEPLTTLAGLPAASRTPAQTAKLRAGFLDQYAPEQVRRLHHQVRELIRERDRMQDQFPTTMIMEEMPRPRDSFVLIRGEYDKRGEKVQPGVPPVLPPLPALPPGAKNNRLVLARWLVDPGNPLTARVAVNRFWQMYFGTGLVKTVDDFGSQGEPPSHPDLLDYLATEFVRTGWNVKALQKQIVTSNTYRQASQVSRELFQRDPDNRLLARGPRFRLPAEMIRDQALFVSGLLVEKVGGPSVRPYQPPGLEKELGADPYKQDSGPNLYRRSLYTFWKRTVAPPMMINFDAPGRETCLVRETRTNTPLQALNLLNDVTFVEASRNLAQRVLRHGGASKEEQLTLTFRLVLARKPRPAELQVLRQSLEQHRAVYRQDREAALRLLQVGESPHDPQLDPAELAALTNVAAVLLNLDEAVTKE